MRRLYTVSRQAGDTRQPVFEVKYDAPEGALAAFTAALRDADHHGDAAAQHVQSWAAVLMAGGTTMSVPDADYTGAVSISITYIK